MPVPIDVECLHIHFNWLYQKKTYNTFVCGGAIMAKVVDSDTTDRLTLFLS